MKALLERLAQASWRAAYYLEEGREAHAAGARYWRSGWCCFGLALLRLGRLA